MVNMHALIIFPTMMFYHIVSPHVPALHFLRFDGPCVCDGILTDVCVLCGLIGPHESR